jgi:hypothetical protein
MKKILILALIIAATIGLTSCGSRGADGDLYFGLDWYSGYAIYADLTGTDLPSTVTRTYYYLHGEGTWDFTYYLYDGYYYSSTYLVSYTLTADPGEPGQLFFKDGAPGTDHYYSIYCGWYGATLYDDGTASVKAVAPSDAVAVDKANEGKTEYTQQFKSDGWIATMHVKRLDSKPAGAVFSAQNN